MPKLGELVLRVPQLQLVARRRIHGVDRADAAAVQDRGDARDGHLGLERLRQLGRTLERVVGGGRLVVADDDVLHGSSFVASIIASRGRPAIGETADGRAGLLRIPPAG